MLNTTGFMQQKLPENIDQMEDFYKEQFQDFSPEVNNAVWENISHNIPTSTGLGTSVSTSYLLKVVGLMLGGIGTIAVVTDSLSTKRKTVPEKQEIITPIVAPTEAPVSNETVETPITEKVDETTTAEENEQVEATKSKQSVTNEKATTQKAAKEGTSKKEEKDTEKTEKTDFQFVEEIEFE